MQHVMKSRSTSAVHVKIGDWKGNPSRHLEVVPNNKDVQNALQEVPGTRNAKLGPHSGQELWQGGKGVRPTRSSIRNVNYVELGSSADEIGDELQQAELLIGLLFTVADSRYIGKDTAEAGSVILNADKVRQLLRSEENTERRNRTVRLTTS